jgi:hypothetical protein
MDLLTDRIERLETTLGRYFSETADVSSERTEVGGQGSGLDIDSIDLDDLDDMIETGQLDPSDI